jgi:hypothetical protein
MKRPRLVTDQLADCLVSHVCIFEWPHRRLAFVHIIFDCDFLHSFFEGPIRRIYYGLGLDRGQESVVRIVAISWRRVMLFGDMGILREAMEQSR